LNSLSSDLSDIPDSNNPGLAMSVDEYERFQRTAKHAEKLLEAFKRIHDKINAALPTSEQRALDVSEYTIHMKALADIKPSPDNALAGAISVANVYELGNAGFPLETALTASDHIKDIVALVFPLVSTPAGLDLKTEHVEGLSNAFAKVEKAAEEFAARFPADLPAQRAEKLNKLADNWTFVLEKLESIGKTIGEDLRRSESEEENTLEIPDATKAKAAIAKIRRVVKKAEDKKRITSSKVLKIIVAVVVIAVIAGGAFFLYFRNKST
jgi:hypothetical protein